MRGEPADPRPATPVPPGLGTLVPAGHQEGDHGGLPRSPRHAQGRTQPANTPRTRHLPPEQTSAPTAGKHHGAAEDLNRPGGLLGPRARKRACAVLRGPRCSNAPGLPGRRASPTSRRISLTRQSLAERRRCPTSSLPSRSVSLASPLAVTCLVASSCVSVGSLVSPTTGVRSG